MQDNESKQKSPQSLREEETLQFWQREDVFKKTLEKPAPAGDYVFYEGPPTANGRPGIHHVESRSFKDIIPRYKTMRGFRVRRKAGWDTHGLPVELQVEKALGLKSKKEIESYGVAAFNQKCKESVWEYKNEWENMTRRMGYWLDLADPYITYKNSYIEALWGTVKRADERGHLYKDFKVLPWCTRCGTALSSHELNQPGAYKDIKDLSIYAKFKIVGTENGYFLAWTTTPWTLPGNIALAVGNDIEYVEAKVGDEILVVAKERLSILPEGYEIIAEHKGSEMVGMQYEPLYSFVSGIAAGEQKEKLQNAFKVYAADFVTTTDGTGIVHIAPMYGADDFDVATKNNLPKIHTVSEEGKFVSGTGFLEGRYVKEKAEDGTELLAVDIIKDLAGRGQLFRKEKHEHSYPHCWRCDTPLLYYARTSWYFRMSALRDQMLAANAGISWEPKHIKAGRFGEWLDGIKDWAISRDRYWGTPLPIWHTEDGSQKVVIGSLDDVKKYAKKSGNKYFVMRHGESESNVQNICSGNPENNHPLTENGREQVAVSARKLKNAAITKIICSPNLRARQTAQIVADTIGIAQDQIIIDSRIKEFNFGDFEGRSFEKYVEYRDTEMHTMDVRLPNGESFQDVKKRVGDFLYDIEKKNVNETILIVAHGVESETVPSIILGSDATTSRELARTEILHKAEFREFEFVPLPHNERYELDFHKPFIDQIEMELDGQKLVRTPEVMDVWFDSGAMPYAQDHVLGAPMDFAPATADYISEGVDQTRGWFYTLHAVANMMNDKPAIAYKNVVCLGLILDAQGIKMSKSKGNIVNPWDMFDTYGADALRFWMYSINQPGDSKNFDEKTVDEVNKKVFNLLRNVAKFYDLYREGDIGVVDYRTSPHVLDQWIITKTDELIETVTVALDTYKMMESSRAIRDYIADLSQWYIRRSRDRFKSDDTDDRAYALATTRAVLMDVAKLMAPFTPFFAEELYQSLRSERDIQVSVHLTDWPQARAVNEQILSDMESTRTLVTKSLEARAKSGIKIRQPLQSVTLSVKLDADYEAILADELNVKEILHDPNLAEGEVTIDTTITDALKKEGQYREFLREIQELRKRSGLEPSDKVVLNVQTSPEGMDIIETFKPDLMKIAGITEIIEAAGETTIAVDDLSFSVTLVR